MTSTRLPLTLSVAGPVAALALLAACASTKFDGPDGDRRLYEARCGFCHVPYAPGDFRPADWPAIVADMGPRAGLNAAYRERVLTYIVGESERVWAERATSR